MRTMLPAILTLFLAAGSAAAQTTPPPVPPQTPPPKSAPAPAKPEPLPFPADFKMGFIDAQMVFSQSKLGKAGQKKVQDLENQKTQELQAKAKEVQDLNAQIQQQGGVLSPAVLTQKQSQLDTLQRELQHAQQDAQAARQALQDQLLAEFQEKVVPVVEGLAKEKGLYVVFNVGSSAAVYVYPGLDLSAEVIRRLDAMAGSTVR